MAIGPLKSQKLKKKNDTSQKTSEIPSPKTSLPVESCMYLFLQFFGTLCKIDLQDHRESIEDPFKPFFNGAILVRPTPLGILLIYQLTLSQSGKTVVFLVASFSMIGSNNANEQVVYRKLFAFD